MSRLMNKGLDPMERLVGSGHSALAGWSSRSENESSNEVATILENTRRH